MMLPIINIDGQRFFLDRRLRELRNAENPHERIALTQEECESLTDQCEIRTFRNEEPYRPHWLVEVLCIALAALSFLAFLILL